MSAGKKLINSPATCVADCLQGLVMANSGLKLLEGHEVIIRADIEEVKVTGKVTLLSGGGSGHEPAHAGYVGAGMLSGAVAGAVFTSPPPSSILAAIKAVGTNNPRGTLLIVKNYTGDRLNFGIASERAKAAGIRVEMVVVGEDCALTSADKSAGRRGLCGTVLIHKIAGAMAELGLSLDDIVQQTRTSANSMGTIGLSLSPCSVPGSGPSFQLEQDQMELGLGIHGEAGVKRIKVMSAKEAVKLMIDHLSDPSSSTHIELRPGSKVVLMVNNLGGTSMLELGIITKEAIAYLGTKQISVMRCYCGAFMTSLEMAGVSLTIMHVDEQVLQYLDTPTSAPGWVTPLGYAKTDGYTIPCLQEDKETTGMNAGCNVGKEQARVLYKCVKNVCDSLIKRESELNELDTGSGDGDCGFTMARGAKALLEVLGPSENPGLPVRDPHSLLLAIASLVEQHMGGSSGALYSLFLTAAAGSLSQSADIQAWINAFCEGVQAVMRYGGAEPGDRTMVDSMYAASEALKGVHKQDVIALLDVAAQAAEDAAKSTTQMNARAGRASYVNTSLLTRPDPGATAVAIWLRAIHQSVTS